MIKKLAPMGIAKLKKFALEQRTRTCSRLDAEKCGKGGPMDCDKCGSLCGSPIMPNKASYANHIWDHLDGEELMGATACIVIPRFIDWVDEGVGRDWRILAWFIHAHLPYSEMVFFARNGTVNLTWRGDPDDPSQDGDVRRFDGSCESIVWRSKPRHRVLCFVSPKGLWIKNGKPMLLGVESAVQAAANCSTVISSARSRARQRS